MDGDGGWHTKFEMEVRRYQELTKRLSELEKKRNVNFDILFEDFWQ